MSLFKLDENLPRAASDLLRESGHDVRTVLDQRLGGQPDPDVAEACRREGRILVTLDLDFADTQRYPPFSHSGIWVLRGSSQSVGTILSLIRGALALTVTEPVEHRLWLVEHGRVRIRV